MNLVLNFCYEYYSFKTDFLTLHLTNTDKQIDRQTYRQIDRGRTTDGERERVKCDRKFKDACMSDRVFCSAVL